MDTEIKTQENIATTPTTAPVAQIPTASAASALSQAPQGQRPFSRDSRPPRSGGRRPQRSSQERVKPEFDTKIIAIRRVTRVASGGRKFTFSVAVVSGDKKGKVGVGLGKAGDTSLAIDKATRHAKKNMIKVRLSPAMTIPHMVEAKFSSACVMMMPARGRGVVAGSAVRNVIELAGIKDVCAKLLSGSKNKLNIARATIKALEKLSKYPKTMKDTAKAEIK